MSITQFLVALTLGAAALALWINYRFPGLAPDGIWIAVLHVGASIIAGQVLIPGLLEVIPEMSALVRAVVTTFLLGLPVLVYTLLASIWVIRIAQGALLRR